MEIEKGKVGYTCKGRKRVKNGLRNRKGRMGQKWVDRVERTSKQKGVERIEG